RPSPSEATRCTLGQGPYTPAFQILDGDMPQHIADRTNDEPSHTTLLGPYLRSNGACSAALYFLRASRSRTLPARPATGSRNNRRLINLSKLTVDTSCWGRYRTDSTNPDLGDTGFVQAVPTMNVGPHTAIPRTDADANNPVLSKAIAFTSGFHFAFME